MKTTLLAFAALFLASAVFIGEVAAEFTRDGPPATQARE